MSKIPSVLLHNEVVMPQLGLGVWKMREDNGEVEEAVRCALDAGYRLIDTAAIYGNEKGVGRAIAESGIARSELFITTKLWNSDQGVERTRAAFNLSLERLGLDYVDLYLIHWPAPHKDIYVETWKELEKIYAHGLTRAIGVSNFKPTHLDKLIGNSDIVPAINQIEVHPRYPQKETIEYCLQKGIVVESYSPLGSGGDLLQAPVLTEIGHKYGKTPAQVVLRWHIQQGLVVIPKSIRQQQIIENATIFDFELALEDFNAIAALNINQKIGADPDTATF